MMIEGSDVLGLGAYGQGKLCIYIHLYCIELYDAQWMG